jgi:hypothetical protein
MFILIFFESRDVYAYWLVYYFSLSLSVKDCTHYLGLLIELGSHPCPLSVHYYLLHICSLGHLFLVCY